jgi:hypothetical protein
MKQLEELKLAYRRTFASDDGQAVMADMGKRFHFNATTFVPGDAHQSAFLEGQRSVLLTITRMMTEEKEPERNQTNE